MRAERNLIKNKNKLPLRLSHTHTQDVTTDEYFEYEIFFPIFIGAEDLVLVHRHTRTHRRYEDGDGGYGRHAHTSRIISS